MPNPEPALPRHVRHAGECRERFEAAIAAKIADLPLSGKRVRLVQRAWSAVSYLLGKGVKRVLASSGGPVNWAAADQGLRAYFEGCA
jgi:hypothetical protein